jgi:CHAT domain-containing protein/Flp pilus assembly protein TadD
VDSLYQSGQYQEVLQQVDRWLGIEKNIVDSLKANLLNLKGNAQRKLNDVDAAIQTHRQALNIRTTVFGSHSLPVANSSQNIGNCYLQVAQAEQALPYLERTAAIRADLLQKNDATLGSIYMSLAYAFQQLGRFDGAYQKYDQALAVKRAKFGDDSPKIVPATINLAQFVFELDKVAKAKELYEEALELQLAASDSLSELTALAYTGLGNCFLEEGRVEEALNAHQNALAIYENDATDFPNSKQATCYQNIGNVYLYKGEVATAISHYRRSSTLYQGERTKEALQLKNNLGLCYKYKGEWAKALQLFDEILSSYAAPTDLFLAGVYENIGSCLYDMEAYDEAKIYYQKALNYYQNQPQLIVKYKDCLSRIGDLLFKMADYAGSLAMLQDIFSITSSTKGQQALHCFKLGRIYHQQQRYETALQQFDLALQRIETSSYQDQELQLSLWLAKGESQYQLAITEKELAKALTHFQQAKVLLETHNQAFEEVSSIIYLNDRFTALYDGLVTVSFDLGSYDSDYYSLAYQYTEESKAVVLKQQINWRNQRMLPDSIVQKEQELFKELQVVDQIIFEETNRAVPDEQRLQYAYDQQFTYRQELKKLNSQSRFDPASELGKVTVASAQKLLHPQQTILQYHIVNDQRVYLFVIHTDRFHAVAVDLPEDFSQHIVDYYNNLKTRPDLRPNPDAAYANYTQLAQQFYELLFQPVAHLLQPEIIIIPDKLLVFLPFETFLRTAPTHAHLFKSHAYLIRDYQFSYSYSVSLLQIIDRLPDTTYSSSLLAIAPEFFGQEKLNYNIPEVKSITQYIRGKKLLANKAQESTFKQLVDQPFQLLHFSTHGVANEQYPKFSYLAFASPTDSTEDGRLYVSEITNLSLPADVVFLSACESNIGRYYNGEGLMSLSRAFIIAGAKSTIASLWKIDDEQTKYIVETTYRYLQQQLPRNQALHQAKLDYLAAASPIKAHPYYWSALLLVGEEGSLEIEDDFLIYENWMLYLLGIFLLIGSISLYLIKKLELYKLLNFEARKIQ